MSNITDEQIKKAIIYYRNRSMKFQEISNLTNISVDKLVRIYREEFKKGTLKPRRPERALHGRTPNGQGKHYVPTGVGMGGRNKERKKFTDEQEQQIAEEYYTTDIRYVDLVAKWGIHPVQMQRIRKKFAEQYGGNKIPRKRELERKEKDNDNN